MTPGIRFQSLCFVALLFLCGSSLAAQGQSAPAASAQLTVDAAKIVSPVSPTLYGLMTEEINHSYDGGLYAELVRNPTFRNIWSGIQGWELVRNGDAGAAMSLDKTTGPSAALSSSLKLEVASASSGNEAGVSNSGYWGIALRAHTAYRGSLYAKVDGASPGPLTVRLISDDSGAVLAEAQVALHAGGWSQYNLSLTTGAIAASSKNHLQLTVAHPETLWLQLVSLFPPTFNDRPDGLRPDLMALMAAMHPHFLRLPGGNYLEGDTLADWYDWKKTIGPRVNRPGHQAPWSYWSTDGLGLLEFLEWCEDLHVEPVLAVYAGYALKGEHVATGHDLEPYVQSAVDEVEYVTGDVSTKWGAERARDGHPAPFPLHYIEIGNEDEFDKSHSYDARFAQFAQALRQHYPQYKLIATTRVKEANAGEQPDLIDDHFYKSPAAMFDLVHHYDNEPRTGPKIFVGEWATRSGSPTPNFGDALGDAAWMTAMERNSDLILMASYAPLLTNVNPEAMQWPTDLIGYDESNSYGSPSYYAQCLFATHLGDGAAQTTITGAGARFFYSATVSSKDHVLHLKLVNASDVDQALRIRLTGISVGDSVAQIDSLHAASFEATNSITLPKAIQPVVSTLHFKGHEFNQVVPQFTIQVIDIPLR
ncbi:alpha-L-arabinofuranosidase C-terminal domain-containing protein [Granulicella sp. S156]|uniref:alpha-L-arabinofuranosidase C-terminal domain-containing protein n=1 Tax=Granulicella sp. S156 TaxID=1747224 RepID=UPI00131BA37F|nr:alpha-L-arabinofuranosidase C-terminal domain-containing protein [Granulicella sp. S156]